MGNCQCGQQEQVSQEEIPNVKENIYKQEPTSQHSHNKLNNSNNSRLQSQNSNTDLHKNSPLLKSKFSLNNSLAMGVDLTKGIKFSNGRSQSKKSLGQSNLKKSTAAGGGFDLDNLLGVVQDKAESEKNIEIFDQNLNHQLQFDSICNQNAILHNQEVREQIRLQNQQKKIQGKQNQRRLSTNLRQKQENEKFAEQQILFQMDQFLNDNQTSINLQDHVPQSNVATVFKGSLDNKLSQQAIKVISKLPIFEVGKIPSDSVTCPNYYEFLDSGNVYIGQWKKGKMNGHGKLYFNDGGLYEGNFFDGKISGEGRYVYPNGDLYQGGFNNSLQHQKGEYKYINGDTYIGEFNMGKKEGKGIFTKSENTLIYNGQYKNNLKHGQGNLTIKDLYSYNGNFVDDQMHGKGECKWFKKKQYNGEWKNNKMHGYGVLEWLTDGKRYQGNFVEDLFNGEGEFKDQKGNIYKGQFKDGFKHGKGVFTDTNGKKYNVKFENDKQIQQVPIQ